MALAAGGEAGLPDHDSREAPLPREAHFPLDRGHPVEVLVLDEVPLQHRIPVGLHQAAVALPLAWRTDAQSRVNQTCPFFLFVEISQKYCLVVCILD